MTPRLKISSNVLDRLSTVNSECLGYLFGLMYDGALLVVGVSLQLDQEQENEEKETDDQDLGLSQARLRFPGEVDLCGFLAFHDLEITSDYFETLQQDVHITDNPVLLRYNPKEMSTVKAQLFLNENLKDVSYEVVTENDVWKQFIHVRLQAKLPLICELQLDAIIDGFQQLRKKIAAGMVCFHFHKSSMYLMSSDTDNGLSGLTGDPTVGELCNMCMSSDSSDRITEGCGKFRGKKKYSAREVDVLNLEMLLKTTRDLHAEPPNKCAPVIHHVKRAYTCIKTLLPVDAISMVHRDTKMVRLYAMLVDGLCRNLRLAENCFLDQISSCESGDIVVSCPQAFHFLPHECGHFVTVFYPKNQSGAQLEEERRSLHKQLLLPLDKPFFRRGCAHVFSEDIPPNSPLVNVHEGLNSSVKEGEVSVVHGTYSYHHYCQDRIDDNGWGCAYRSLQTIVSWFRWQGYTDKPIPSHRDIQQCLVNIGDKPASFVGSTQWIGSTEVSFCLESLLGITSRIISVSSGEELGSKGGELEYHFKHVGTPVMIGGGVLAHTILGVDFNRNTGELKFLILDPHYTGGEDLQVIQGKGWCGWKGVDFWKKTAYYNLCLPQRPRCL